jgi:hypothetical protein
MRKLKSSEILALTTLMVIGSASAEPECEMTGAACSIVDLETVHAEGGSLYAPIGDYDFYELPNGDLVPYDEVPHSPPPPLPVPSAEKQAKVLDCVNKYSSHKVPASIPVLYTGLYLWGMDAGGGTLLLTTAANYPPGQSPSWYYAHGMYYDPTDDRFTPRIFMYYTSHTSSAERWFTTLAHEGVHANGVWSDATANAVASSAYQAYINDGGAKCGGLISP